MVAAKRSEMMVDLYFEDARPMFARESAVPHGGPGAGGLPVPPGRG